MFIHVHNMHMYRCMYCTCACNEYCNAYTCTCTFYVSFAEMISADNVAFLCELMDEIGRKDLTDEVKSYIERTEGERDMCTFELEFTCLVGLPCLYTIMYIYIHVQSTAPVLKAGHPGILLILFLYIPVCNVSIGSGFLFFPFFATNIATCTCTCMWCAIHNVFSCTCT